MLSHVRLFATPWTVAYQAPLSLEFSRQEYWSGLPFLFPGDLPDLGIKSRSPTLQADYLPSEPPGKPTRFTMNVLSFLLEKRRKTRANQVQTKKKKSVSCSVVSDSLQSHGLQPTMLFYLWNSPGKNTGVGSLPSKPLRRRRRRRKYFIKIQAKTNKI